MNENGMFYVLIYINNYIIACYQASHLHILYNDLCTLFSTYSSRVSLSHHQHGIRAINSSSTVVILGMPPPPSPLLHCLQPSPLSSLLVFDIAGAFLRSAPSDATRCAPLCGVLCSATSHCFASASAFIHAYTCYPNILQSRHR